MNKKLCLWFLSNKRTYYLHGEHNKSQLELSETHQQSTPVRKAQRHTHKEMEAIKQEEKIEAKKKRKEEEQAHTFWASGSFPWTNESDAGD